jgi:hypothetical protein
MRKLIVLVVTKPMKNLLLRTGCNVVGVNNGGMKTVQATKLGTFQMRRMLTRILRVQCL